MSIPMVLESACHCGALKLEISAAAPEALTSCNCSVCRRYGSLWAYFSPSHVKVLAAEGATDEYSYGDKNLAFVRCKTCGCLSHWRAFNTELDRMGVNARLFTNLEIDKIRVRHLDGADTWKYFD